MVLCHGGPGGYDYLGPVADMVSDVCQVVRYDQRGSGRSQPVGPYDVSIFIDDLEELRKHFNKEYPVSNEANEKVGADWKSYTTDSKFQQSVYNLSMPVLFLHGACDPRPIHFIETLAAKLSRSTFVSIPESGHYPWIEKPDEVKAALRQFIVDYIINDTV